MRLASSRAGAWVNMSHDDLARIVVQWLNTKENWHRAVSLDIEGDLGMLDNPEKIPLSISIARRTRNDLDIRPFILKDETIEDEIRLVGELGMAFEEIQPLMLIGYGIGRFDLPVLSLKLRRLETQLMQNGRFPSWYWATRQAITRSYVLDMMDPVRYELGRHDGTGPKFVDLEHAICHRRFCHLPFMKAKPLVSSRTKGAESQSRSTMSSTISGKTIESHSKNMSRATYMIHFSWRRTYFVRGQCDWPLHLDCLMATQWKIYYRT
jgi:hypothetical protein